MRTECSGEGSTQRGHASNVRERPQCGEVHALVQKSPTRLLVCSTFRARKILEKGGNPVDVHGLKAQS